MGTIVNKDLANGRTAYVAQVAIKRDGTTFRKSKSFDREKAAAIWIRNTEAEMSKPGAIEAATRTTYTLADAIDKYTETNTGMGRTKEQVLKTLRAMPIAGKACETITSQDIVALADDLGRDKQPQTVLNYMSHLQSVFTIAEDAWNMPLDMAQMAKAMRSMRRLGAVKKSNSRDRRPTLDELDRLMSHFQNSHANRPATCPMHRVIAFALFSTRRQEEITRITWADYEGDRVLVRDMKHPGQKIGNHVWVELPAEAQAIAETMPRTDARMFPYNGTTISAAFTRACDFLGIEDLHFHDLRHEGISRLSELGWTIQRVTMVSGHRSLASLNRYTHMRAVGDKYAGWKWLEVVTTPVSGTEG